MGIDWAEKHHDVCIVDQEGEILEELAVGEHLFASVPDDVLRQLFQTFRLEVRFDKPSHRANCRVTIDDDSVAAMG